MHVRFRHASAVSLLPEICRYIHVAIMIFVGFGFLMTFLKRYSNSAVALNFFTSCLVRHTLLMFICVLLCLPSGWPCPTPWLLFSSFCSPASWRRHALAAGTACPRSQGLLLLCCSLAWLKNLTTARDSATQQVMLEFIVVGGAIQQMAWGGKTSIELDLPLLIDACFAAGAAMISFGAVLGRTTPSQITFLLVLQVPLASFDSDDKGKSVAA